MNRKWALVLAGSAALISLAPAQQKAIPSPAVGSGRYQLQPVTVDENGNQSAHEMFLLDTETGKVWRYQAGGQEVKMPDGSKQYVPEMMVPIPNHD